MRFISKQTKHKRRLEGIYNPSQRVAVPRKNARRYYKRADRTLYQSRLWKKMRMHVLGTNPICAACGIQAATDLDHIIPHQGDRNLFFDIANVQPLCKECHRSKTAAERDARKRVFSKPRG